MMVMGVTAFVRILRLGVVGNKVQFIIVRNLYFVL